MAETDRPDLPWGWTLRIVATMDGARFDALLYLLPGFIHLLLLPLHRETQSLRLDDLLGERCRLGATARPIPAFRSDFS